MLDRTGADDDLLVIAGDNLFGFDLRDYVRFWRGKGVASAIAVHDVGTKSSPHSTASSTSGPTTAWSASSRSPPTRRRRWPRSPSTSTTASTSPLVGRYLAEGNPPDQPGNLVAWLHAREPVYAWRFDEEWFDIGDHEQLLEADNRLRRRAGLPERDRYELDTN